MDEFVERMTYALQARRDPDFLIIGRTDAFSAVEGSREELVRRGNMLKELGVDAVMPRGVRTRDDLAFFRQQVPDIPLVVITGADDIAVQEYGDLGYQLLIYATTPVIVTATALTACPTDMERGEPLRLERVVSLSTTDHARLHRLA